MARPGILPEPLQETGDDEVLLLLGQHRLEPCSRDAALEQQRLRPVEQGGLVQEDGAIAVPQPQCLHLMLRFGMGPPELEHQVVAVGVGNRRDPRALTTGLVGTPDPQQPPVGKQPYGIRHRSDPFAELCELRSGRRGRQVAGNRKRHASSIGRANRQPWIPASTIDTSRAR